MLDSLKDLMVEELENLDAEEIQLELADAHEGEFNTDEFDRLWKGLISHLQDAVNRWQR